MAALLLSTFEVYSIDNYNTVDNKSSIQNFIQNIQSISVKDNENLVMHPSMDKKRGIPYGHYPLPQSWKIQSGQWSGPNNTQVIFNGSNSMDINYQYYQTPQQILAGELGRTMRSNGAKVISQHNLYQVAEADNYYARLIAMDNGVRPINEALGFEFEVNGQKAYGIIKTSLLHHEFGGTWSYSIICLDSDGSYIDQAVKHLIYGLSNFKPNMKQVAMYKAEEQMKSDQSWAAHNARMRANSYNSGSSGTSGSGGTSDKAQRDAINGIWEENTFTNPHDGSSVQGSIHYDRTFVDPFGDRIQTNDQFYVPPSGYEEVTPNR